MATAALPPAPSSSLFRTRLRGAGLAIVGLVVAGLAVRQSLSFSVNSPPVVSPHASAVSTPAVQRESGVGALGRLEPGWKIFKISPSSGAEGSRVTHLQIREGELIEKEAVMAILDTYPKRQASVAEAKAQVAICQARLKLVEAGPKPSEVAAQAALIAKHTATVQHAQTTLNRSRKLREANTGSAEDYEFRFMELQTSQSLLDQARNTLVAMETIRPEDIAVATAELQKAEASLARANAELDAAQIVAPISGRVLKIHAREGERVGDQGLAELGDTNHMQAVAEVYERDAARVKLGQRAIVKVQSLAEELTGEVVQVGWMVGRQEVFDNDPIRDTDARVVEVRILLDGPSSARVAGLSYARIEVSINTGEVR